MDCPSTEPDSACDLSRTAGAYCFAGELYRIIHINYGERGIYQPIPTVMYMWDVENTVVCL